MERIRIEYPGIEVAEPRQEDFESSEFFQLLVDAVKDYAIFMLDPNGYIRTWNSGAERNKGYLASEIVGQHFSIFYVPEDRIANRPERLLQMAAAEGRIEDEGWRLRKDGTRFWADVVLTPLFSTDGLLRGFAKITRDMTEQRQMVFAMQEALSASKAKTAFLANMSHELRTPLNAIIGYAELLEEQLHEKPEAVHDIRKIIFSGRHLLSVISDVLDLSKIEAGHLELNYSQVDVLEVVNEVVETARLLADRNHNEVRISSTSSNIKITTDAVRLRQLFYNVFSNACKFTKDGRIEFRVSTYAGEIEIRISDTGIGMTKIETDRIFDNFYQARNQSPQEKQGGTGLGLAISRLLVQAMGGTIGVTSVKGEGSTFIIRIPKEQKKVKNVQDPPRTVENWSGDFLRHRVI